MEMVCVPKRERERERHVVVVVVADDGDYSPYQPNKRLSVCWTVSNHGEKQCISEMLPICPLACLVR